MIRASLPAIVKLDLVTTPTSSQSDSFPAFPPFLTAVPSTYLSRHPSSPSLFHSRLKTSLFLQILSAVAFLFFFGTDSTDSPDCLPILSSRSVFFYFLVFLFSTFCCSLHACGRLSRLMSAKITSRIVSCRNGCRGAESAMHRRLAIEIKLRKRRRRGRRQWRERSETGES